MTITMKRRLARKSEDWIAAARVATVMEHNRMGVMGHYYGGMLDIYSDLTRQCSWFGGHIEMLEVDELAALRAHITDDEIATRVREFHDAFDVQPDCSTEELTRAARTSLALDRLVDAHALGKLDSRTSTAVRVTPPMRTQSVPSFWATAFSRAWNSQDCRRTLRSKTCKP